MAERSIDDRERYVRWRPMENPAQSREEWPRIGLSWRKPALTKRDLKI
jgi:hypothetical protein